MRKICIADYVLIIIREILLRLLQKLSFNLTELVFWFLKEKIGKCGLYMKKCSQF